jgi:hypothetical protein
METQIEGSKAALWINWKQVGNMSDTTLLSNMYPALLWLYMVAQAVHPSYKHASGLPSTPLNCLRDWFAIEILYNL